MTIFSKIRFFFSKHRNKFIIGTVIISGTFFLTKYAQQRLKEWQERETLEFLERNRKQNHFESIGKTCNQTAINLSSTLFDTIYKAVNTDDIIENLKSSTDNKLEVWNRLKVSVFAKTGVIIYSIVILIVTLKIQLSIVGGYLYKNPNSVTIEMQEQYLTLCQNFLNCGIEKLAKIVESEIYKILKTVDLKKELKLSDIEAIFWSMQTALATNSDGPIENFKSYLVLEDIPASNLIYDKIIQDTADFLESDEVKSLATHCISRGFILLGDQISNFYSPNGLTTTNTPSSSDNFHNPFDQKKPLAKLLPILNGLLSRQSVPQQFLQQLLLNEKLQILNANIYESLL